MPQDSNNLTKAELKKLLRVITKGLPLLGRQDLVQAPCPDSWTLASYATGGLDTAAEEAIHAHLAFCDSCFEEYLAVAGPEKIEEILAEQTAAETAGISEPLRKLLGKAKMFVIDLGKTYGPGALIGPIRISTERAAFATRGRGLTRPVGKVLEITVGDNSYSMDIALTPPASLSCDIAAVRRPVRRRLRILVRSEPGDEVASIQSDAYGNCHFTVPAPAGGEPLLLFTLKLKDHEEQILIRIPAPSGPA